VWLVVLSDQLPIVALVGRYPANWLMGRNLLEPRITAFTIKRCRSIVASGIS
jgi:hypothetical protein